MDFARRHRSLDLPRAIQLAPFPDGVDAWHHALGNLDFVDFATAGQEIIELQSEQKKIPRSRTLKPEDYSFGMNQSNYLRLLDQVSLPTQDDQHFFFVLLRDDQVFLRRILLDQLEILIRKFLDLSNRLVLFDVNCGSIVRN